MFIHKYMEKRLNVIKNATSHLGRKKKNSHSDLKQ